MTNEPAKEVNECTVGIKHLSIQRFPYYGDEIEEVSDSELLSTPSLKDLTSLVLDCVPFDPNDSDATPIRHFTTFRNSWSTLSALPLQHLLNSPCFGPYDGARVYPPPLPLRISRTESHLSLPARPCPTSYYIQWPTPLTLLDYFQCETLSPKTKSQV